MNKRWKTLPVITFSAVLAASQFGSLLPYSTLYAKDSKVQSLEIQTTELSDQLSSLNNQVTKISNELDSISTELDTTNEDIRATKVQLVAAREKVQDQYDAMKKRIRYMYENGSGESLLQMMLSSESMADFVNKADFISEVSGYDREMLEELSSAQNEISKKESELSENKEKLTKLKGELESKQQELNDKVSETSAALSNSKAELAAAEQAAIEREKAMKGDADGHTTASSGNSGSDSSGSDKSDSSLAGSTSDLAALAAIIECEAGGESYKGKVAVGAVVMNRLHSSRFPNTIMGVITQKNQFSPVASGRFSIVLARGARSSCVKAAKDALAGSDPTGGCLSFRATWSGNYKGLVIGNQVFF